jgi:hypothetical protein
MNNQDGPVIKSFIDMAQQALKTTLDDIETRILQVCNSCTSAQECHEKLPALDNEIVPNDLQALVGELNLQIATIGNQNPDHYDSIMSVATAIDAHYVDTLTDLRPLPSGFGSEILVCANDGGHIFPHHLKLALDELVDPFRTASAIFFGWLELQPIRRTVS